MKKASSEKYASGPGGSLARSVVLIAAACLTFGVQQGIHDSYGIMMSGLLEPTG